MKSLLAVLKEQGFENVGSGSTPSATAHNARMIVEAIARYLQEEPAVLSTDLEWAVRKLAEEKFYVVDGTSLSRLRLDVCIPRIDNGKIGNPYFSEKPEVRYLYLPNVLCQLQATGKIKGNMTLCLRISGYTQDQKTVLGPSQKLIDVDTIYGSAKRSTEWVYFTDETRMQDCLVRRIEEDIERYITVTIEPRM